MSLYVNTFLELRVAITLSGNIRSPSSFDSFSSAFNALWVCISWFLTELPQFLPNLNHMVLHGLGPLGLHFTSYQELARPTLIFLLQM